jgi:hypothetical protein
MDYNDPMNYFEKKFMDKTGEKSVSCTKTFPNRTGKTLVVAILLFLAVPFTAFAELKAMSESDLKSSTGQAGFAEFSLTSNLARLFLDIHIETYGTIRSLNFGNDPAWDQQWDRIQLGNSDADSLSIDGLVLMAEFNDTSSPSPVLERIIFGSNRLQGSLKAEFNSFSGVYNDALLGNPAGAVYKNREAISPNPATFQFDSSAGNMGLFFILNLNSTTGPALEVVAGYNETTLPDRIPTGKWWDSP